MAGLNWSSTPLEEFLICSKQVDTLDELCLLYQKALECYGFDRLAYTLVSDVSIKNDEAEIDIVYGHNLNNWDMHYMESNYYEVDFVSKLIRQAPGIFEWNDIIKNCHLSPEQLKIFQEAEEARLFRGATFSIHGPDKRRGVSIVSSSQKKMESEAHVLDIANIFSYQFHLCLLSLTKNKNCHQSKSLSEREKEVLKWTSKGFTRSEIGEKLNISTHTIDYHIRGILKKLQAKNINQALVIAIKNNILSI